MSAIQGILILSLDGRPILHSSFRHPLTSYPLLHIDALNNALHSKSNNIPSSDSSMGMGYDSSSVGTDQFTGNNKLNQEIQPVLWVEGAPTIQQVNRQLQDDDQTEDRGSESEEMAVRNEEEDQIAQQATTTTIPQDESQQAWNDSTMASTDSSIAETSNLDSSIWGSSDQKSVPTGSGSSKVEDPIEQQPTANSLDFSSPEEAMNHVNAMAEQGAALIHVDEGELRFLCPVIGEVNPLLPLSFLRHLILILHHYLTPSFNSSSSNPLSNLKSSLPSSITSSFPFPSSSNPQSSNNSSTLTSSTDHLTEIQIRDHFPLVYHLLEEMLDDGNMLTTEWNALRDVVVLEGWSEAVKRRIGISGEVAGFNTTPTLSSPFSSPIPWRRAQPKVPNSSNPTSSSSSSVNEIYLDITERLEILISSKNKVLSAENWGRIQGKSKLKGLPTLTVSFQNGNQNLIVEPTFHACVRNKKWEYEGVLDFVPPDGRFTLAEFRVGKEVGTQTTSSIFYSTEKGSDGNLGSNSNKPTNQSNFMTKKEFIKLLPIDFKRKLNLNLSSTSRMANKKSEFEIEISSKLNQSQGTLKNIVLYFTLGDGAHDVDLTTSTSNKSSNNFTDSSLKSLSGGGNGSGSGTTTPSGSGISSSTFYFDPLRKSIRWEISTLTPNDGTIKLKGSWETTDSESKESSLPSNSILTTFEIQGHSISGLKVKSIGLSGENYKLFKGVRNSVEGEIEWRW